MTMVAWCSFSVAPCSAAARGQGGSPAQPQPRSRPPPLWNSFSMTPMRFFTSCSCFAMPSSFSVFAYALRQMPAGGARENQTHNGNARRLGRARPPPPPPPPLTQFLHEFGLAVVVLHHGRGHGLVAASDDAHSNLLGAWRKGRVQGGGIPILHVAHLARPLFSRAGDGTWAATLNFNRLGS